MVVEVTALLGAAKAATEVAQKVHGLVSQIRSGRFTNNDQAKQDLERAIVELQQNLAEAGELAKAGGEYAGVQQDVVDLLWECEHAHSFLKENGPAANTAGNPGYEGTWGTIAQLFASVERQREPLFREADDRILWLNEKDRVQISQRLQEANSAAERASQAVRSKAGSDLDVNLRRMIEELRRVQSSLNDTVRKEIFGSLGELSR